MSILVATDFSDTSRPALRVAARLAKDHGEALRVIHFVEGATSPPWDSQYKLPDDVASEFREEALEKLETFLDEVVPGDARPAECELEVGLGSPGPGLPERAEEGDVELVVVGATGRNRVAELLLGSTAEDVVRSSEPPVLVVPEEVGSGSYDRIVAPVDFSECSRRSLELAATFARKEGATLHILHSHIPPTSDASTLSPMKTPERIEEIETKREEQFETFVGTFDLDDLSVETELAVGTPDSAIVDAVEAEAADLVVMGTHGRRGVERLFLGSTAAKILRRMPCSVLTVRGEVEDED